MNEFIEATDGRDTFAMRAASVVAIGTELPDKVNVYLSGGHKLTFPRGENPKLLSYLPSHAPDQPQ